MAKSRIWVIAALVAVLVALVVAPMTAAAAPSEWWGGSGCRAWHTVYYGETMSGIARHYGTTVWAIANANGIGNADKIRSGQHLCIPYGSVKYGDGKYGHVDYGYGKYGGCWYKIRSGDTLSNIAWRYGTSTSHLKSMNGIGNANKIYAGHWLRVPCYHKVHYGCGGGYCY